MYIGQVQNLENGMMCFGGLSTDVYTCVQVTTEDNGGT